MTDQHIKFLYLRDTACPDRVLTIARRIVDTETGPVVEVTHCCNRVDLATVAHLRDNFIPRWVVRDRFDKKRARLITTARFNHPECVTRLPYRKGHVIEDVIAVFSAMVKKATISKIAYRASMQPKQRYSGGDVGATQ